VVRSLVCSTVLGAQRQRLTTVPLSFFGVRWGVSGKPPVRGGSLVLTWLPLLFTLTGKETHEYWGFLIEWKDGVLGGEQVSSPPALYECVCSHMCISMCTCIHVCRALTGLRSVP
jgi:hypothetical protein